MALCDLNYMVTALRSFGVNQHASSLLQLGVQYSKTRTKNQLIKIEICIHGWEDGVLYHRKEILANQTWLIWEFSLSQRKSCTAIGGGVAKIREQRMYYRCSSVKAASSYFSCHSLHGWRHISVAQQKTSKHSLSPDGHRQTLMSTVQAQSYAEDRATPKC